MKHIVSITCLGMAFLLFATSLQARVLERQTMRDWTVRWDPYPRNDSCVDH